MLSQYLEEGEAIANLRTGATFGTAEARCDQ
jgi:hypothetical protein